ncbi:MAG: glycosyl hydrolase family 98 [Fuerstiella sp.]|nr:glycosyl hydrolase family 98 [Fuerstiella sp.]MCP4858616.1 glycosyl hydrolase family 98 [Fuerstiella sp.]
MRCVSIVLPLVAVALLNMQPAETADAHAQATAARRILDTWHADQPKSERRSLHLVCWTPSDKEFPKDYKPRLTRIMRHIQDFYLREMERHGLGDRTFNLNYDDKQQLVLHTVNGRHTTNHYSVQSGNEIRKECLPVLQRADIEPDRETILILCNLASWDEEQLRFTHKSPYYAGGSFRRGTAWQLDSPELDPRNLSLTKPMIRDGQYGRISLGKHNSIFIGGIAHELGHALGLPHCKARPDETVRGTALMGSGNRTYGDETRGDGRGSFLTLAHALRLASHPQFSGSVKGLQQTATASIDDVSIVADDKAIQVSGVINGDPPIYAVVAYFDPDGGGDYNATTATAIPSADGRFTLRTDALPHGKQGQLRLFPLHANGSAGGQMSRTKYRYSYDIADDGTPDLSMFQIRRQLAPVVAALVSGDRDRAALLATDIKLRKAWAIAVQLTRSSAPVQTPAEFEGDSDAISLTNFKSTSAKVGWGRPAFNHVPDDRMLLESGGQIFETGIYAHAPARHTYQIDDKWNSLTGKVGLASGHGGSVRFELIGDGRTLWKSQVVNSDSIIDFDVKLDGVQQLELLTHPTDDGPGADWALWLQPLLKRTPAR